MLKEMMKRAAAIVVALCMVGLSSFRPAQPLAYASEEVVCEDTFSYVIDAGWDSGNSLSDFEIWSEARQASYRVEKNGVTLSIQVTVIEQPRSPITPQDQRVFADEIARVTYGARIYEVDDRVFVRTKASSYEFDGYGWIAGGLDFFGDENTKVSIYYYVECFPEQDAEKKETIDRLVATGERVIDSVSIGDIC